MKRPSFLTLPRPVLVCITGETTVEANISNIRNAEYDGAHAFAVHLEKIGQANHTNEALRRMTDCTGKPVMMLHYRDTAAVPRAYTDEERMELLKQAIRCGAACVDLTADTFDAGDCEFTENPHAVDRQRRFIDEIHELGGEVILSSHIQQSRSCDEVVRQMLAMEKRGCDIAKIVTVADTEDAFVDAIKTTLTLRRTLKVPFIHLCGGAFARPQRLLGPTLGSMLTFCVHRYSPDYISVQPPVVNMLAALRNLNWSIDEVSE